MSGELVRSLAYSADSDPACAAAELGQDGTTQAVERRLGRGKEHDGTPAGDQQDAGSDVTGCPAHGVEERLLVSPPSAAFHYQDLVRAFEVVVQSLGQRQRALLVGAAQQVVDEFAADP